MKTLEINEIEDITGGGFIDGLCAGIMTGSAIYAVGAITNFWNPVGWVSKTFIVADLACVAHYWL